jgi:hypothetical protein
MLKTIREINKNKFAKDFAYWMIINLIIIYNTTCLLEIRNAFRYRPNIDTNNILVQFLFDLANLVLHILPLLTGFILPILVLLFAIRTKQNRNWKEFLCLVFCIIFSLRWSAIYTSPFEAHPIETIYLFLSAVLYSFANKVMITKN